MQLEHRLKEFGIAVCLFYYSGSSW